MSDPRYKIVPNEGARLKVWSKGSESAPLLVFCRGPDGAEVDNGLMDTVATKYLAVTYDRRGNEGSTVDRKTMLNPAQAARDIKAIIDSYGRSSASIFTAGNAGPIAFQLAVSHPSYVDHLLAFEVPSFALLPDSSDLLDSLFALHQTYREHGIRAAFDYLRETIPDLADSMPKGALHRLNYTFEYEQLVLLTYMPSLWHPKQKGVSMAVAHGNAKEDSFWLNGVNIRSVQAQSRIFQLKCYEWERGQNNYVHTTEGQTEMGKKVLETLADMEERKQMEKAGKEKLQVDGDGEEGSGIR